jgi:hypothetical protein
MDFSIKFDQDINSVPDGGVILTQDGSVYQRIKGGPYRGLFRDLRRDETHGVDFGRYTKKVHRIMTPLENIELAFLGGWYAGRLFEMQGQRVQP